MKKKIVSWFVVALLALTCFAGLSACGSDNAVNDHEHEYIDYVYNNDATCISDGTETAKCTKCSKKDTRVRENTATGIHSYNDFICKWCYTLDPNMPVTEGLSFKAISGDMYSVSVGNARENQAIKIPSEYKGKPVTYIPSNAFSGCENLISICIPDSVCMIARNAFAHCDKLIQIENGVKYVDKWVIGSEENVTSATLRSDTIGIADNAFYMNRELTDIIMPNGMKTIGNDALSYCRELTRINIPSSVVNIYGVFDSCRKLEEISVENGNEIYKSIGNCLIKTDTKTLITGCKNSVIPDDGSVTAISSFAFRGCSGLTDIIIPNTVTDIGNNAFASCTGLQSITLSDALQIINESVFSGCTGLTEVTLGENIYKIGKYAFLGCSGLTSFTMSDNVIEIGGGAFSRCENLTRIVIPAGVSTMGSSVFIGCHKLTIYCRARSKPSSWDSGWNTDFDAVDDMIPVVWNY